MIKIDKRNGLCKPETAEKFLALTKNDIDFFNLTQLRELRDSIGYIRATSEYGKGRSRFDEVRDAIDAPVELDEFMIRIKPYMDCDEYDEVMIDASEYADEYFDHKSITILGRRFRKIDQEKIDKYEELSTYMHKRLKEKEKKNNDKKERELYKKLKKKFEG